MKNIILILAIVFLISCRSTSKIENVVESAMDACNQENDSISIVFSSSEKLEVSLIWNNSDTISSQSSEYFEYFLIGKLNKLNESNRKVKLIIRQDKSTKKEIIDLNLNYDYLFIRYNSSAPFPVIDIHIDSLTLIPEVTESMVSIEERLFLKYTCARNQKR